MDKSKSKELSIRSSAEEFLVFSVQSGGDDINVRYENETLWLTQKAMGVLFDISVPTINEHLSGIYGSGELEKESTIRKFRIVQMEGNRQVSREVDHYNLDVIISVGYRVNSMRATQL